MHNTLQNWFYEVNGASVGPHSSDEIFELCQNEIILSSTNIWHASINKWTPAGHVPAFYPAFIDNGPIIKGGILQSPQDSVDSGKDKDITIFLTYAALTLFFILAGAFTVVLPDGFKAAYGFIGLCMLLIGLFIIWIAAFQESMVTAALCIVFPPYMLYFGVKGAIEGGMTRVGMFLCLPSTIHFMLSINRTLE